jgi:hypothetical protein
LRSAAGEGFLRERLSAISVTVHLENECAALAQDSSAKVRATVATRHLGIAWR